MLRRIVDIAVALTVLTLASPLLLAVAAAVVIDSPGSALYGGWRVGRHGRRFRMWKFRTMITGADRVGSSITGRNDPRITRVGGLLRKTKLDELPQFVNVLFGDMTLVGPRPEVPEIVALYSDAQRAVLNVKPGITGRVQIESVCEADNIPEGAKPDEFYIGHMMHSKLDRDLEYLRIRTPWSDARVVLGTAALVLRAIGGRR